MKIVVLGGAGVFGSRIARMLVRDDHEVIVAGRSSEPLEALASEIGADTLVVDRSESLEPIWGASPDLVIDAAGPFHAYGEDRYRLAKGAIEAGAHYLDLADDADFCRGISVLNVAAKKAGVFALSGVSSVPSLSSSVVKALAQDEPIESIQIAILPGNRAPRGQSVVDSILFQAGTTYSECVDGHLMEVRSWSNPRWIKLAPDLSRLGFAIRVPDQDLLPDFFKARSVQFHAGLDLWISNWGLAAFSWLRSKLGFGVPQWMSRSFRKIASWMERFGSNVGGMAVDIVVRTSEGPLRRSWRLVAKDGEGPFIPGIPARVVASRSNDIPPGARPALAEFPLDAALNAMSDLSVTTSRTQTHLISNFERVLGGSFSDLPRSIQSSHQIAGPVRLRGRASVIRGNGLLERMAATIIHFPKAADDTEVEVIKIPENGTETWVRRFDNRCFRSHLAVKNNKMTERFGPLTFGLNLNVDEGKLSYPVETGHFLGIPIPRWLLPRSVSHEYEVDQKFHFDVALYAPITNGLIVRYQGWLKPVSDRSER